MVDLMEWSGITEQSEAMTLIIGDANLLLAQRTGNYQAGLQEDRRDREAAKIEKFWNTSTIVMEYL